MGGWKVVPRQAFEDLERETGIEPATSSLGSWRSTAELLPLNLVRLPLRPMQDNVSGI
jgi:hypothetical protein